MQKVFKNSLQSWKKWQLLGKISILKNSNHILDQSKGACLFNWTVSFTKYNMKVRGLCPFQSICICILYMYMYMYRVGICRPAGQVRPNGIYHPFIDAEICRLFYWNWFLLDLGNNRVLVGFNRATKTKRKTIGFKSLLPPRGRWRQGERRSPQSRPSSRWTHPCPCSPLLPRPPPWWII